MRFIASKHWAYSHACRNLDYELINIHLIVVFVTLGAKNYSQFFFSKARFHIGQSWCVLCSSTIFKTDCIKKSLLLTHSFAQNVFPAVVKHRLEDFLGSLIQVRKLNNYVLYLRGWLWWLLQQNIQLRMLCGKVIKYAA